MDYKKERNPQSADAEENYGLIRPSLIKQLRSILDQYPDDGQIIKELIQNAEDAGAATVQFLFDQHRHGTTSLHDSAMAEFQGPALYSYNNALFTEKDWKGIRMLQDSVKEKDPMKVGRFGLGFKSVLHMTDLPSVLSGDRLFMIDPHEKYFQFKGDKTSGYSWHLGQKKAEVLRLSDQFSPFSGVFGSTRENLLGGHFNGTLFRFPLRQNPSTLSTTVYKGNRVEDLFKSFEIDAHLVLLFLKKLEHINLSVRKEGEEDPTRRFEVKISDQYVEYTRTKKKEFMEKVKEASVVGASAVVTFQVQIETITYNGNETERQLYKFLVNEYYAGGKLSVELTALAKDPNLSLTPMVGTAMELDRRQKPINRTTEDKDGSMEDAPTGQVFCFLPLPVEQKSSSGLPVHVNGFFAVSQNRRHLKWPSAGQNAKADKSVFWNQCLIKELVPKSYLELLRQAVHLSTRNPRMVTPADVYSAIPNLVIVNEKWQALLPPLFTPLFCLPFFHTILDHGKWIEVEHCVFDCLKEDAQTREVVRQCLLNCRVCVVAVPMHILHALGAFSQISPEIISPSLVRNSIKDIPQVYTGLPIDVKLSLLRYVLKDEDFRELQGISLLPTANGEFQTFHPGSSGVFIPTQDCCRGLLPNLEQHLISEQLDDLTRLKLGRLADEGTMQVRHLTPHMVAKLLPGTIPPDWRNKDVVEWDQSQPSAHMPPSVWLELLWDFLRKELPRDLSPLHGLPLLPISSSESSTRLIPLQTSSFTVLESAMGTTLEGGTRNVLQLIGVYVIVDLPQYARNHAAVLGNYVKLPLPEDIIEVILAIYKKKGKAMIESIRGESSSDDKLSLLRLLSKLNPRGLNQKHSDILKKLPLFETTAKTSQYVSVSEVNIAAPVDQLPFAPEKAFLNTNDPDAKRLAQMLGVTFLNLSELLKNNVLSEIRQSKFDKGQVEVVADHIFNNFQSYAKEDPSLLEHIANVAFISTEKGRLEKPRDLCDPESEIMRRVFQDEDVFPSVKNREPERLLLLRKLGLKSENSLTPKDLLQSIIHIEDMVMNNEEHESIQRKALATLKFLAHKPDMLLEDVNGQLLMVWASIITWIPVLHEKPSIFPSDLPWAKSEPFRKPSEVKSLELIPLLGSVMPVTSYSISPKVDEVFGWSIPPPVNTVLQQLKTIYENYNSDEKSKHMTLIVSIYDHLSSLESEDVLKGARDELFHNLLWHGDGFTCASKVVLKRPLVHMHPYLFTLPTEMRPFAKFYHKCGVPIECTSKMLISVIQEIATVHRNPPHTGTGDSAKAEPSSDEISRDLQLVIDILNQLKDSIHELPSELRLQILVPTQVTNSSGLRLLPVIECTYCDVEWVRQGFDLMTFDEQDGITFIHPNLPIATAEALEVPTLMSRMLNAEELAITGFGQSEPLTNRLKRLLEDYTDGLAIPKEIIQNADDAGATEVKFLYDERSNGDSMKYLIDEGMKECQGPALWAYNDAVFTDKDFENITKLGGATKEQDLDKIGKFGLGFNAVYNITDVPSFISRDNIVIFDPHTTHLGRGIRDRTKPGIKIDMKRNKTLLRKLPDQFRPYEGVFGCKVIGEDVASFDGTLFRLPLRTKAQATKSEISALHYDRVQVLELIQILARNAHGLLLFTQNVQKVTLYYLQDGMGPDSAVQVLQVEKRAERILRQLSYKTNKKYKDEAQAKLAEASGILKAASLYMRRISQTNRAKNKDIVEQPRSSIILNTHVLIPESAKIIGLEVKDKETFWLVSACMGEDVSISIARTSREGLVPAAGVAAALEKVDDGFIPVSLSETDWKGHAYCYLPLPINTGLPVHINALFAVQSNRRQLSELTEDDKQNSRVEWNQALLDDAVTRAYIQMLQDMRGILPPAMEVKFYTVWPSYQHSVEYFHPLVESFYRGVASLLAIPLYHDGQNSVSLANAVFLDPVIAQSAKVGHKAMKAFASVTKDQVVVAIPKSILESFKSAGLEEVVRSKTYDITRFYEEILFPHIGDLESELRNPLVIFAVMRNQVGLDDLIKSHNCIPTSPNGNELSKPDELIHPTALASKLYSSEDGRFPHGESFVNGNVLGALQRLGLKVNEVSWFDLVERANSLQTVHDIDAEMGKKRLHNILLFIDRRLLQSSKYMQSYQELKSERAAEGYMEAREEFGEIAFLKVLSKPANFPIKWHGDDFDGSQLLCPSELFTKDMRYLVSSTQPIIDEENMTPRVKEFLSLSKKQATIEHVMTQLEHALNVDPSTLPEDGKDYDELQRTLFAIYNFIQDKCLIDQACAVTVVDILSSRQCILVGNEYLTSDRVAFNFPYECGPYLYSLPHDITRRYRPLMKLLGVKEQFDVPDYMRSIHLLQKEYPEEPLRGKRLDLSVRLVSQLNNCMKKSDLSAAEVEERHGPIYVPNTKGVLKPSSSLCFNDCPWIGDTQSMNFTHPDLTFQTSACLGVKTKRQEALSKHATGIPFGQKERLTNSLRRILNSYPCDHEILKELIQNADDAKATQIHFIRDPRHHPETHVFENSWKPLQGPALCVFNNMPFTMSDLEGIQRLGEGSKVQDPSKTGQYGVGFSSVYHLTDVPSVLTSGADVGGKTLCVFDPHCTYVPGASPSEPGMRFEGIDDLKEAFPDVFGCYLDEFFKIKDSTMFRFPLRNSSMAERSQISKTPITLSKVQTLLDKLKDEAFEILLFTNYLEEISISDINPQTGKLTNTYTVKSMLSKEDLRKRAELAEEVKRVARSLKDGELGLSQIPQKNIAYTVFVTDTSGNQEKWAVTRHLGYSKDEVEVPDQVSNAFNAGDLALLPRGGASCLLERRVHGRMDNPSRPSRVFCFLPLPVETDLPVHINGHFALGYENRRHLWSDMNSSGYKREWNDFLCQHVISHAYVALLEFIRMQGMAAEMKENIAKAMCNRQILDSALKAYEAYFPNFSESKPEWDILVRSVYCSIAEHQAPVMPAIREWPTDSSNRAAHHPNAIPQWQVLWLPPKGEGANKAFFSKIEKDESDETHSSFLGKFKSWFKTAPHVTQKTDAHILKEVLLDCGFKLLEATPDIVDNFCRSGVFVDFMQPDGVILFLRSHSTDAPMCDIGELPCKLSDTPFSDERTLKIVLGYCKQSPDFLLKLDGLPLLLSADDTLRVFDSESPVFYTEHQSLIPECADRFLKKSLMDDVFKEVDPDVSVVFTPFTIQSLADMLDKKLPPQEFYQTGEKVEWARTYNSLPNVAFVKALWTFLRSQVEASINNEELQGDAEAAAVRKHFEPLMDWSLLPSRTPAKNYLVPLSLGSNIIDFSRGASDNKYYTVGKVMKKLNMPELDVTAINTDRSFNTDAARALVTTVEKPSAVLKIIHAIMSSEDPPARLTKEDDCVELLRYFAENVDALSADEANIGLLRDLPFYSTIYGDVIKLTDCLVYILPAKIPTNGIDIWQSKAGTVFLERSELLQALYDYMGCASISIIDVYCKFIFQHFEYFPPEDRMVHLHHVYSQYVKDTASDGKISAEEKESLIEALRQLPFIEDEHGELQPASSFYDPENVVFRIMLPEEKFPPRVTQNFRESEWYSFLGKLGLIREVGRDMYLDYTRQVAREGVDVKSASALTKSKVLVQHLYGMSSQSRDTILADIATVPFIAPEPASRELTDLYPQHGDVGSGKLAYVSFRESISKDHEKLVWTRANMLPDWADPMEQQNIPIDEKAAVMETLEIQKTPNIQLVTSNLLTLCDHFENGPHQASCEVAGTYRTRMKIFKAMYRFLQTTALEDEDVKEKLAKTRCIMVDGGKNLVLPKQTALNMYDSEEIRPFLYKVPMELGEFQCLFQRIGSTDRASLNQYADVLANIRRKVIKERLTPNELRMSYRAVRGLLDTLENTQTSRDVSAPALYLPSEEARLVDATRLVFNDSPSFYDRVKEFGLQFLVDLRECGYQSKTAEEVLRILPPRLKPGMLSTFVKEVLVDRSTSGSTEGLAAHLNRRLKSESFLRAVARLIRHEAHRSGRTPDDQKMYSVLDRLSTISVYEVEKVITQLTFKDKPVARSEVEKVCFVQKLPTASLDIFHWKVFIKTDSSLSQDLLIPLAEVINTILSGMLRDSVLYLLPIMACSEEDIQAKLNTLNVRLDHSQITTRAPTLPLPGTPVPHDQIPLLVWGEVDFTPGEFCGYRATEQDAMMLAEVREEVMSPEGDRVYLLDVGDEQDSVIVNAHNMHKYIRR